MPTKLAIDIQSKEAESLSSAESEEQCIIKQVKKLVENGDVLDARSLLSTIPPRRYPEVDHWRKVLAKPKARREALATGGGFNEDSEWLQKNSEKYKGKWVALKRGVLLGSHERLIELHRMLKQSGNLTGAMLFQIEN